MLMFSSSLFEACCLFGRLCRDALYGPDDWLLEWAAPASWDEYAYTAAWGMGS